MSLVYYLLRVALQLIARCICSSWAMMKTLETDNIFKLIPKNLEQEVTELLLHNKGIEIERIISKGQSSPDIGWYNQARNEWILLLQGAATITFEGNKEIKLEAGSFVNIPAHTKHKVTWTDPKVESIWLAVFYE